MAYEYLDEITSDVMFRATAPTLKELFEDCAKAMMSVMYNLNKVEEKKKIRIEIAAENEKELLYKWLSELLAQFEINEMLFSKFNVSEIDNKHLRAEVFGDDVKPELIQTLVKGVTMYRFDLKRKDGKWIATVVVDI
ncbi:MAG: archease [Candidatus Diapherotrites archaeon]|nr:archease [Candidatus Diapherotrites archaeon]